MSESLPVKSDREHASSASLFPGASLSLRHNFLWSLLGGVIYGACQWGMLMTLAKLGSTVMVGRFSLGLAICAPVIMFTNLHLRAVQITDAKDEYVFGDYLGLRLLTTAFAFLVIAGIVLACGYGGQTAGVVLVIGAAKCVESISDVFYGLFQKHERMDMIALSMILKGSLSLLALGIVVYMIGSVLWGVAALFCVWSVVLLAYDLPRASFSFRTASEVSILSPRWNVITLGKLAWLALPLGLVMLLISLNTNIPRYFVKLHLGEGPLGIFAAMAYLIVAGNMIVHALGQSVSPKLARFYAAADTLAYRKLLLKMLGFAFFIGISAVAVAYFAGGSLLTLIYKPEYAQRVDVFVLVMIAAAISWFSSSLGYGITAARLFKVQVPLNAGMMVIVLAGSAWLIPGKGLVGAGIVLISAFACKAFASLLVVFWAMRNCRKGPAVLPPGEES
jgi:O-antigen/teichoic acid export membrane protein